MERQTRQRAAILGVLAQAGRPLSSNEAHRLALRLVPGIGIATIYRSVKALLTEGILASVELPGQPPRYEIARDAHHHHFHCRRCDRVFDVAGCTPLLSRGLPKGFRVENHEVVLYGKCAACA